jgi:hypothetical protein
MEFLAAFAAAISLVVPGRTGATPSVAADGTFVAVAWSASETSGATDVYVAVSRDAARSFGPPVRVNDVPGQVRANGEQPPRIVLTPRPGVDPALTVVWTAKGKSGTRLVFARSDDGGASFGSSDTLADTDTAGNRGWHNVVADSSGRVHTIWLDHRELARDESMPMAHHDHVGAGKPDGVVMAQKSKLYIESLDGAIASHAITGGVCYCCKTAIAAGTNDQIYVAWRHVYPGNIRDIAFTRSSDGGRTFSRPIRVSEDHWILEGCPDDGPAMAVAAGDRIHVVWPTVISDEHGGETIALFYASSRDGAFGSRLRLPTEGIPHHPVIAVAPDGVLIAAWDESVRGSRRAVVARARVTSDGQAQFVRAVVSDDRPAAYPAVVVAADSTVVAWTVKTSAGSEIAVSRMPSGR